MKTYATVCKNLVQQGKLCPLCPLRVSKGRRGKPTYHKSLRVPRNARNVRVCYGPKRPLPMGW